MYPFQHLTPCQTTHSRFWQFTHLFSVMKNIIKAGYYNCDQYFEQIMALYFVRVLLQSLYLINYSYSTGLLYSTLVLWTKSGVCCLNNPYLGMSTVWPLQSWLLPTPVFSYGDIVAITVSDIKVSPDLESTHKQWQNDKVLNLVKERQNMWINVTNDRNTYYNVTNKTLILRRLGKKYIVQNIFNQPYI